MANLTSNKMRVDAQNLLSASHAVLDAPDFKSSPLKQVQAIVAQVNSTTLQSKADLIDWLDATNYVSDQVSQLQHFAQRQSAIREAAGLGATTGDWSKFDEFATGSNVTGQGPEPEPEPGEGTGA